jgi:hypothetical protein
MVDLILDSIDGIDESLKPAYVERDGKFILDPDKYTDARVKGLKNKNTEVTTALSEARAGLRRFERFKDLDDAALDKMLEGHNSSANGNSHADQLKRLNEKHATEKTRLEGQVASLSQELKGFKLTVPLRDAALKAGMLADYIDLALFDTMKSFRLEADGKIVVLDADGDPTDMTPQRFFDAYKLKRPHLFPASGAGGSGTPSNQAGGSGRGRKVSRATWDGWTAAERTEFSKSGGQVTD